MICYYRYIATQRKTPNCSQCGSPLIFVREVIELPEGSRFPQTTTTYRCSNVACQIEKDKQTEKRLKILRDKQESLEKRAQEKRDKKA